MTQEATTHKSGGVGGLIVMLLLANLGYTAWVHVQTNRELAARPPVAVMNVVAAVEKRRGGKSSEEVRNEVNAAAKRLGDAGFLVLLSDDLAAFPEAFEVTP